MSGQICTDYQEILKENYYVICKYINPGDFNHRLVSARVLSPEDKELIENQYIYSTRRARAAKLVDVLMTKGPQAYEVFLEMVEFNYPHLFTEITKETPRKPPADFEPNRNSENLFLLDHLPHMAREIQEKYKQNKGLSDKLTELTQLLELFKQENNELEGENHRCRDEVKCLRMDVDRLQEELNKANATIQEKQSEISEWMRKVLISHDDRDDYRKKAENAQLLVDQLTEKVSSMKKERMSTFNQFRSEFRKGPRANSSNSQMGSTATASSPAGNEMELHYRRLRNMTEQIKILNSDLEEQGQKCSELAHYLQEKDYYLSLMEEELNQAQEDVDRLRKERDSLDRKVLEAKHKNEAYYQQIQRRDEERNELEKEKQRLQEKNFQLNQEKNALFKEKHDVERTLDDLNREHDMLRLRSSRIEKEKGEGENSDQRVRRNSPRQVLPVDSETEFQVSREKAREPICPTKSNTLPANISPTLTDEEEFERDLAKHNDSMKVVHRPLDNQERVSTASMAPQPSKSMKQSNRSLDEPASNPAPFYTLPFEPPRVATMHPPDKDSASSISEGSSVIISRGRGVADPRPVVPPKPSHISSVDNPPILERQTSESSSSGSTLSGGMDSFDSPLYDVYRVLLPQSCTRTTRKFDKERNKQIAIKMPALHHQFEIKGGNHTGIYISKVIKCQDLLEGDEIQEILCTESGSSTESVIPMKGKTLEEATSCLGNEHVKEMKLSIRRSQVEYNSVCQWMAENKGTGDYIYIRCNNSMMTSQSPDSGIHIKPGDLFCITNSRIDKDKKHHWLGRRVDRETGRVSDNDYLIPDKFEALLKIVRGASLEEEGKKLSSGDEAKKRNHPCLRVRGTRYDRVLPMKAVTKLPVVVVGLPPLQEAVLKVLAENQSDEYVVKQPGDSLTEFCRQNQHVIRKGNAEEKFSSKKSTVHDIFVLLHLRSISDTHLLRRLFGADFLTEVTDEMVKKCSEMRHKLLDSGRRFEELCLSDMQDMQELLRNFRERVSASQDNIAWLSKEEMDPSIASKYVSFLGNDNSS